MLGRGVSIAVDLAGSFLIQSEQRYSSPALVNDGVNWWHLLQPYVTVLRQVPHQSDQKFATMYFGAPSSFSSTWATPFCWCTHVALHHGHFPTRSTGSKETFLSSAIVKKVGRWIGPYNLREKNNTTSYCRSFISQLGCSIVSYLRELRFY